MACIDREGNGRNYILETIRNIDRMQKDIGVDQLSDCISCETSLITLAFNTVPITFFMCNGSPFSALITSVDPAVETSLFRIESIRDDHYVVLRLINETACVSQTCVLDIDCVCAIQCFQAINCANCGE